MDNKLIKITLIKIRLYQILGLLLSKLSKMKQYLNCQITNNGGTVFSNPLKISEAHLVPTIVKGNKCVLISLVECSKEQYKSIFG